MAPTNKKTAAKKPAGQAAKSRTAKKTAPAGPREEALANDALKLVDKAAALLRKGIRSGAETTQKTRLEAKHQAHGLLTKASSVLGNLLNESTSTLHKVINKI
jgi:IS5 family transposase